MVFAQYLETEFRDTTTGFEQMNHILAYWLIIRIMKCMVKRMMNALLLIHKLTSFNLLVIMHLTFVQ